MRAESIQMRLMSMLAAIVGVGWLVRDAMFRVVASGRSSDRTILVVEAVLEVALALLLLAGLVWLALRVRRAVGPVSRSHAARHT